MATRFFPISVLSPFLQYCFSGAVLLLILSFPLPCLAQQSRDVDFEGTKRYKRSYLFTLIQCDESDDWDEDAIEMDVQQLRNLAGIREVEPRLDTLGDNISLVFDLQERLTILPIFGFGRVTGNAYFQLGAVDLNFLGRGHQLSGYYLNQDKRHNGNLYYRAPRLGDSDWGFSAGFLRHASVEPLFFDTTTVYYRFDNISFAGTAIWNLNNNIYFEAGGTYFVETYEKDRRHRMEMTPGPGDFSTPKYLAKLVSRLYFLRYNSFYLGGWDLNTITQTVYNPADLSWFKIIQSDFRQFLKVGRLGNVGLRGRVGMASNDGSPFAPFVLDSYLNVRGIGNRVARGTATMILNLEYRQTVLDWGNFGAQIVAFADHGSLRKPGDKLSSMFQEENLAQYLGLGGRLIFKPIFNAIFRFDYGVNPFDTSQRGLVLGLGQYF